MAPNTEGIRPPKSPANNKGKTNMKSTLSFSTLMHAAYDDDDETHQQVHPGLTKETMELVQQRVHEHFPKALTAHTLAFQLKDNLAHYGFDPSNVILGTSFSCDDVCRDLEDELRRVFDSHHHSMGGLAGFCFGGATAFGNMLHSAPDNGHVLVVYGPHVGVDWEGHIGKVNRRGQEHPSACCASAKAAAAYARMVLAGERAEATAAPDNMVDAQQEWVQRQVLKHAQRIQNAENPDVELVHALLDCQHEHMQQIVATACSQLRNHHSKIALVGGIQINTPEGTAEYFQPMRFDLLNHKGELIENLLPEFHNSEVNTATW